MHHKFQLTPTTENHFSLVGLLALVCTGKEHNLTKPAKIAPWLSTKTLENILIHFLNPVSQEEHILLFDCLENI